MVVSRVRGGDGIRGAPPHRSINQEAADIHSVYSGLPASLCILQRGGEDAR